MSDRGRRLCSEAVMLVAVVTALALAEQVWWYLGATIAGATAGWWLARFDKALIGPAAGQVLALAAFGLLILEYGWVPSVPAILALAHFMILVCIFKLLQQRTLRDDAQMMVLLLLLLVVAAVVSGSLWFPAVLVVYMTVGVEALVRFHLSLEMERSRQRNQAIHALSPPAGATGPGPSRGALSGITGLISASAIAVGVALFLLSPRLGEGLLGRFDNAAAARAVTGFADTLNFDTVGPLAESSRPVMRVQIEYEDARFPSPDAPLYFRGAVLNRYEYRAPLLGRGWGWRGNDSSRTDAEVFRRRAPYGAEETAWLFPLDILDYVWPAMVQRYYLEPGTQQHLFTCYPPVEISSCDFKEVHKCVADQVLWMNARSGGVLRYTVKTPLVISPSVAEALAAERARWAGRETSPDAGVPEPKVLPPDPPLPREAEIRELIARETREVSPPGDPKSRLAFVQKLVDFLRSRAFTYTLDPPGLAPGAEPVGEFLLDTRSGYCQHFASALAVMCQLSGIPARVVNGYRSGDYNPVGGFYLVREKHAHSWVEAFVPGMDWQTFDPTPSSAAGYTGEYPWLLGLARYMDYLQFQWTNQVLAYDADLRREVFAKLEAWLMRPAQKEETLLGAVAAFVRELFSWRMNFTLWERFVYWAFSLLVVTLVVLVGYVMVVVLWRSLVALSRWRRTRTGASRLGAEVEFYHLFCRRLAGLGFRRRPDQTPAEFAGELAGQSSAFARAPELVHAYYEVAFGGRKLSLSRRSRIEDFLRQLRHTDRSQLEPGPA